MPAAGSEAAAALPSCVSDVSRAKAICHLPSSDFVWTTVYRVTSGSAPGRSMTRVVPVSTARAEPRRRIEPTCTSTRPCGDAAKIGGEGTLDRVASVRGVVVLVEELAFRREENRDRLGISGVIGFDERVDIGADRRFGSLRRLIVGHRAGGRVNDQQGREPADDTGSDPTPELWKRQHIGSFETGEGCDHARTKCAQESHGDAGPVPQYIG